MTLYTRYPSGHARTNGSNPHLEAARRPAYLCAILLAAAGCTGELGSGSTPPPDPHDQTGDETLYWDVLGDATSSQALYAAGGFSTDEIYLAGEAGRLWRWDGSALTDLGTFSTEDGATPSLYGLWTFSDTSGRLLYVVGENGAIFRYDGDATDFTVDDFEVQATNTKSAFKAITGFARDDVWAAGDGGMYHFDGSSWSRDTSVPGSAQLEALWGVSASGLYAVGADGLVLHRVVDPEDSAALTWETVSLGLGGDLHGVWGTSSSSIYVVGQDGVVVYYDGSAWTTAESGTFDHLWSVWGVSDTQVFAAGTNGTTLYFDGVGWQKLASGSSKPLYSLWGQDIAHVYAVGAWSTFLSFDNDPAPPAL